MSRYAGFSAVLAVLMAFVLPVAASAEASTTPPPPAAATPAAPEPPARVENRRQVGGHTFLPGNSSSEGPLAVSSFGVDATFGLGTATGQVFEGGAWVRDSKRTYEFGGMGTTISFQSVFWDRWALRGALVASFFSGIDGPSALVVGATARVGATLGGEWSHAVGERFRWGLSLDLDRSPQLNILVAAAILEALRDPGASAVELDDAFTWRPGISAAWAPSTGLGLTGRAAYSNTSMGTESYGTLRREAVVVGVAADLDLRQLWSELAMGANLSVTASIPIKDSISGITDVSLGLMYTGRADAAAGVVLGWQTLRLRPQYPEPLRSDSQYMKVVARLYWP
jgi:hypothetical protein